MAKYAEVLANDLTEGYFLFCFTVWKLNAGPHTCYKSTLPLSYTPSPLFCFVRHLLCSRD
jgi:hypothetical protein